MTWAEVAGRPPLRTLFITNDVAAVRFSAPDKGRVLPCALEGIRARHLARACHVPQVLDLAVTADEAHLKFGDTECRVQLPQGPETFAAAVALPLLGIGDLIDATAEDFFDLLRAPCQATFHRMEDAEQLALPSSLAAARGAFLTLFGEALSRNRLDEIVDAVRERLPPKAEFLFATAEVPSHRRQVLLTVIDR